MDPHLNRLRKDYEQLQALATQSAVVEIESVRGDPPETYLLHLNCVGVKSLTPAGTPLYISHHKLSVHLPATYPREVPLLQMLTPVYHPNVASNGLVCLLDPDGYGWAPSVRLDEIVLNIVRMIRYERVDPQNAFNPEAAAWTKENAHLFPLKSNTDERS